MVSWGNAAMTEFLNETEVILARNSNYKYDNKIFASDFNFGHCYCKYPVFSPKSLDDAAPELSANFGFQQLIDIPTRITENKT